jgi:hypothetical protein
MNVSIILSYTYLLLLPYTFCAKYRQKKPQRETLTAEHTERTPLISTVGDTEEHSSKSSDIRTPKGSKYLQDVPIELTRWGQPGYYKQTGTINRIAHGIFHSGKGLKASESLKLAQEQYKENRKLIGKRRREKLKAQGMKKNWRRKGYNDKEEVIGRKVAQLLREDNHIVRHDDARKAAEEWYKEKGRIRSRKYRANKKQSLGKEEKSLTPDEQSLVK